jgi:hypothetical protein
VNDKCGKSLVQGFLVALCQLIEHKYIHYSLVL